MSKKADAKTPDHLMIPNKEDYAAVHMATDASALELSSTGVAKGVPIND